MPKYSLQQDLRKQENHKRSLKSLLRETRQKFPKGVELLERMSRKVSVPPSNQEGKRTWVEVKTEDISHQEAQKLLSNPRRLNTLTRVLRIQISIRKGKIFVKSPGAKIPRREHLRKFALARDL